MRMILYRCFYFKVILEISQVNVLNGFRGTQGVPLSPLAFTKLVMGGAEILS